MEYLFNADKPHFAAWHQVYDIDKGWFAFYSKCDAGPLYYASLCGFYDLAKLLVVKHPEHVNARGGWMMSPLGAALYGKHSQVAELLYDHGADVRVLDSEQWPLLHMASGAWGLVDTVRWLLNHGADANAQVQDGVWTPLHLAANCKHPEIVQMLLEHHADIRARTARGEVALHLAARGHDSLNYSPMPPTSCQVNLNILQLLLNHGADVNAKDDEGSTPLHHSSFKSEDESIFGEGSVEGTRLLLERGANIDAEDNDGDTPFLVALESGHHKMAEFLWGLGTMLA